VPGAFDPEELRQKYRDERDERLRPDGKAQYLDGTGNVERFAADPCLEPAERDPRITDVDMLILGGGWSGLQMAVRLRRQAPQTYSSSTRPGSA
jgi:cyclohexanone monooxygenase